MTWEFREKIGKDYQLVLTHNMLPNVGQFLGYKYLLIVLKRFALNFLLICVLDSEWPRVA